MLSKNNISNEKINKAYEESISRGAYGGKLFGAGGGGFLAFIAEQKNTISHRGKAIQSLKSYLVTS